MFTCDIVFATLSCAKARTSFRHCKSYDIEFFQKGGINMSFGDKIRERREQLKITQEDLSSFVNTDLSRQSISK